jgi:hypothetical protein
MGYKKNKNIIHMPAYMFPLKTFLITITDTSALLHSRIVLSQNALRRRKRTYKFKVLIMLMLRLACRRFRNLLYFYESDTTLNI